MMTDKDTLEFIQSSENIIDTDSDDENETNNAASVHSPSEMKNIMKNKGEGVTKLATEFNVGKASVGDINEWMEEDGETAEFLTHDSIAAAVTQEPMEGGGE
ncbi:hypothetical protein TNCV_3293601 [Trichonephila clavipes]|nr:hypothetical protein TNCV_3293601 [Trichonephila clavipes]